MPGDPPRFTRDYFRQQVAELYGQMGERSFWLKENASVLAMKGLGFVYIRTDGLTEEDHIRFLAVTQELTMREALLVTIPPPWFTPLEGA